MEIRAYHPDDREACLQIMRSNIPEYFIQEDLTDFARFLDHLPGPFFVAVAPHGEIVACGGIALGRNSTTEAVLCYGMVEGSQLRQGIGKELLSKRLADFLLQEPQVERIRVNTTQKIEGFFTRFGFGVETREPDGFGPGLDRVSMIVPKEIVLQLLEEHKKS